MTLDNQYDDNSIVIFIYKIFCNNENVKEIYIGQTKNFDVRKGQHERDSKISDLKLYKKIRENGGWENWTMLKLNFHECRDDLESRQIEQKYIDLFNSTLNTIRAYSKTYFNDELNRHIEIEVSNILNIYSNSILGCFTIDYYENYQDENNKMECNFCTKKLSGVNNLNVHKKTNKKCLLIQQKKNDDDINIDLSTCEFCNKSFTVSNLKKHLTVCKKKNYVTR